MRTILGVLALAALAVGAYVLLGKPGVEHAAYALRPDDAEVRALGEQVYARHCASCHGVQLEGQANWQSRNAQGLLPAPPHDASGHTWHHPDELLFRLTKFGIARTLDMPEYRTTMPAFDGVLNDAEIIAVLSWIKSRWPPSIRQRHDQINAQSIRDSDR